MTGWRTQLRPCGRAQLMIGRLAGRPLLTIGWYGSGASRAAKGDDDLGACLIPIAWPGEQSPVVRASRGCFDTAPHRCRHAIRKTRVKIQTQIFPGCTEWTAAVVPSALGVARVR